MENDSLRYVCVNRSAIILFLNEYYDSLVRYHQIVPRQCFNFHLDKMLKYLSVSPWKGNSKWGDCYEENSCQDIIYAQELTVVSLRD